MCHMYSHECARLEYEVAVELVEQREVDVQRATAALVRLDADTGHRLANTCVTLQQYYSTRAERDQVLLEIAEGIRFVTIDISVPRLRTRPVRARPLC